MVISATPVARREERLRLLGLPVVTLVILIGLKFDFGEAFLGASCARVRGTRSENMVGMRGPSGDEDVGEMVVRWHGASSPLSKTKGRQVGR